MHLKGNFFPFLNKGKSSLLLKLDNAIRKYIAYGMVLFYKYKGSATL